MGFKMLSRYQNVHYTSLIENPSSRRRAFIFISRLLAFALFVTAVTIFSVVFYQPTLEPHRGPDIVVPHIPKDFRTVGLVFYGRRSRVSILDCYLRVRTKGILFSYYRADTFALQRNLKANGGSLDEVIFVARTNDVEDLQWLDHIVSTTPGYSRHNLTEPGEDPSLIDYGKVWDMAERGTMYVKIDDDVVRCPCYLDQSMPTDPANFRSTLAMTQSRAYSPPKPLIPNTSSPLPMASIIQLFLGYTTTSA